MAAGIEPLLFSFEYTMVTFKPALDGFRSTGGRNGTETGRNGKGTVPVWALKMNGPFTVPFKT